MKVTKELIAIALLGLFPTSMLWAAQETISDEPEAVTNQETTESPSDAEVADLIVETPMVGGGGCSSYGLGCVGDPWRMPQPCALQNAGIMLGGWIQQGVTVNSRNPADGFNGPVVTNDLDSEYQMHQLWLYAVKPVNTGGDGWDIGGRVDMMYGTDGRFGANFGLEDRINGIERYGIVIPQAYVEVAYNNLSVKLGHFAGLLDYEVVPSPGNPLYSLSYGYAYGVPQLVTGALADYKFTDQFSAQFAVHRGWMMFEDANSAWDIMAGFKWQNYDNTSSLAWSFSSGPQDPGFSADFGAPGDQERFVYSLVYQQQLTERLRYVLVHNLGLENNGAPPAGAADAEWYGLNNYFLYKINPCLGVNVRFEWFRDDDGARVGGAGNIGLPAWAGRGFAGDFFNVTAGINWRPHTNVIVRPEVRWDWFDGPAGPTGLPFDAGASDDQFTLATDVIITY